MRIWIYGWQNFWRERRSHVITRRAYDNLILTHQRTLVQLRREEQRATQAFNAAVEPCPMCAEFQQELDNAVLDLDAVMAERDEWQQAAQFMERIGFAGVRADGDAS